MTPNNFLPSSLWDVPSLLARIPTRPQLRRIVRKILWGRKVLQNLYGADELLLTSIETNGLREVPQNFNEADELSFS